jgi:hypothetical protein
MPATSPKADIDEIVWGLRSTVGYPMMRLTMAVSFVAAPPDLQEPVNRAGRRYAASIGEVYVEDPFARPVHQGGYPHITDEEWAQSNRHSAEYQRRR